MSEFRQGRRLRLGMVGGGPGAFFGAVHRASARLDDRFELVAGAFSSRPEAARDAASLLADPSRSYTSYQQMADAERARVDGIDLVAVVTPNHLHHPVAACFLDAGINVLCEKPMTLTLAEARDLTERVTRTGLIFRVAYTYTGYPMVRQARDMIASGVLGPLRVVEANYLQDWLADAAESAGSKQAEWRVDPARSGLGGCIGDIGTHAYNLIHTVSGLAVEAVSAELRSFVPGRRLDDDARIRLRLRGGVAGSIWASQVAIGAKNGLTLRVLGQNAALSWSQETPDLLLFTPRGEATRQLLRGDAMLSPAAHSATRLPAGHPEGYLEALGQIYVDLADAIESSRTGRAVATPFGVGVLDGTEGVAFVDASVRSSQQNNDWVSLAGLEVICS